MAKSKLKTNLSILRYDLGELGKLSQFSKLIGMSESWVKKASCGQIQITEKAAIIISFKTGYATAYIQGFGSEKIRSESNKKIIDDLVKKYRNHLNKIYNQK